MNFEPLKSARFWMSIISILVFAYLSCTGMLDSKDALVVITMICSFYFGKSQATDNPPVPPKP